MFTPSPSKRQHISHALTVIALVAMLLVPASAVVAQDPVGDRADVPYQFPVLPGSATWMTFTTHQEMLDATQVPDDVLRALSTKALIRTTMDYPLLIDMYAYNTVEQGFDALVRQFHALEALMVREDLATVAIEEYVNFPQLDVEMSEEVAGEETISEAFVQRARLSFLETLLAQESVLKRMSQDQRKILLGLADSRLLHVQVNMNEFGQAAQESPLWLMGRILRLDDAEFGLQVLQDDRLRAFLDSGFNANDQIVIEIQRIAHTTLIAPDMELHGPQPDDYSVTWVKTPRGSTVPGTVQTTYELSSSDITNITNQYRQAYPCAVVLRNATRRYNCHSYAWYNQASSNTIWMYHPGDDKYWQDGSYQFNRRYQYVTVGPNAAPNGARVSYEWDDHSAIYYSTGWMESKWGRAPLMRHPSSCVPYNSASLAFYVR